jgi:hypothetical protein
MSLPPLTPRAIRICQIAGVLVFTLSFFLPACDFGNSHDNGSFYGWQCAYLALQCAFPTNSENPFPIFQRICLFLSDLLNLLVILYLIRVNRWRTSIAIAMGFSMVSTWIFFLSSHLIPYVGHYLWILGALLVITPEFATDRTPVSITPVPDNPQ